MTVITTYDSAYDPKFDPYMLAIGRVAVTWAEFEFAVNNQIWMLANVAREVGACITAQMIGPGPRFRCLAALFHFRNVKAELISALNSISGQADSLSRQRNRYLHDPVAMSKDGRIARMEVTADRKLAFGPVPLEVDALSKLIEDIDKLSEKLDALFARVLTETPPWPRTQYEQSQGIRRRTPGIDTAPPEPLRQPES